MQKIKFGRSWLPVLSAPSRLGLSKLRHLAITLALLTWTGQLSAATVNWTNSAGGNWSVGTNWSGGAPPTSADEAVIEGPFPYTVTLDVNAAVASIRLGGPQILVINSPYTFTLNGPAASLVSGGELRLAGGTLTGPGDIIVASFFDWRGGTLRSLAPPARRPCSG